MRNKCIIAISACRGWFVLVWRVGDGACGLVLRPVAISALLSAFVCGGGLPLGAHCRCVLVVGACWLPLWDGCVEWGVVSSGCGDSGAALTGADDPEFGGEEAGRDADAGSGEDVAEEMPAAEDEQRCGDEQQCGERQDAASIEAHEDAGEGAGKHHVSGGKAATGRAVEEMEGMACAVPDGGGVGDAENELEGGVVDGIRADGGEAGEECGATERGEIAADDAREDEGEGDGGFDGKKNGAGQSLGQALRRRQDALDAGGDGQVEEPEGRGGGQCASEEGQKPDSIRHGQRVSFRRVCVLLLRIADTLQQ